MNCPACNYMMSDFDAECPRCHGEGIPQPAKLAQPVQPDQTPQPAAATPAPPSQPGAGAAAQNPANNNCAMGCVVALALLVIISTIMSSLSGKGKPNDLTAYWDAQTAIKSQLKSPSTAIFPSISEARLMKSDGDRHLKIVSYVEGQNEFGASIRQDWYAHFNLSADGKRWVLESAALYPL